MSDRQRISRNKGTTSNQNIPSFKPKVRGWNPPSYYSTSESQEAISKKSETSQESEITAREQDNQESIKKESSQKSAFLDNNPFYKVSFRPYDRGEPANNTIGILQQSIQRQELEEDNQATSEVIQAKEITDKQRKPVELPLEDTKNFHDVSFRPYNRGESANKDTIEIRQQSIQRQESEEEKEENQVHSEIVQRQELEEEKEQQESDGVIQAKCSECEREEQQEKEQVQTKLTVGKPGDKYEQEADSVAAKVVEQINSPSSERIVQGKVEPVVTQVMRQGGVSGGTVNQDVEQNIQQARGSGQGLADNVREPMEQAFGTDFSGVKVHTDGQSDVLNRSLNARAFTTGQDIFFKQGEYQPGNKQGQELLAHELTHVVQQNAYGNQIQRWHPPGTPPPENQLSPDGFIIDSDGQHVRVERLWYEQHYQSHKFESNQLILQRLSESSMPWIAELSEVKLNTAARVLTLRVPDFEQRDVQTAPIYKDIYVWIGLPPGTNVIWEFPKVSASEQTDSPATPSEPVSPSSPETETSTHPVTPDSTSVPSTSSANSPTSASAPTQRTGQLIVRATDIEPMSGNPTISSPLLTEILDRLEAQVGSSLLPGTREEVMSMGHLGTPTEAALSNLYRISRANMVHIFGEGAWLEFEQRVNESGNFASGEDAGGNLIVDPGIPNEEQHFVRRMMEELFGEGEGGTSGTTRITSALVSVLHEIDEHPERTRIIESLRNNSSTTEASGTLAASLRRAMQTVDMQAEYERLNLTPGEGPARERDFPWPVEGRIVNHTDLLFTGKDAAFSVEVTSHETPELMLSVPWVNVHWVVRRTSQREVSAPTLEEGHTSHMDRLEPPERFSLSFSETGTYEINAIVDHDLFAPNHFTIFVEVRTEQERFTEVQDRAYSDSLWGEVDDETRVTDHEFQGTSGTDVWDTGTVYEGDMMRECGLGMPPVPGHLDALERRISEVEAYSTSEHVDARGREWATEYLAAMEEVRSSIRSELDGEAQLVYMQAAYLSRGEGATSQPLQLVAHAEHTEEGWKFIIHDTTQAFDNRNSQFEETAPTYRGAVEQAFTELCKSYPRGLMSARIEILDNSTGQTTGRYVGFELECNSTWEAARSVAYHPVVSGVINIAGTAAALFIPGAQFMIPVLIAYNAVDTVGTMVDLGARDALTITDVGVGAAQLAMDIIPYVGRATRLIRIGTTTYRVMVGLENAGEIILMTAQAQEQVQSIRMGVVRQAAEVHARIRDLETNNPSDPELPRLREQFGQLQTQANEAWLTVGREMVAQEFIMRASMHVIHGIHQRHTARVEQSRQTLTEAMSSRGHANMQLADRAHVSRVMGVPVDTLTPDDNDIGRGDVRIAYEVGALGGITNIRLLVGPEASLSMVMHHERTLAAMRRYEGVTGSLHNLLERVQAWVSGGGHIPPGTRAFEARFELQKLPPIIQSLHQELTSQTLTDETRSRIESQIASLEQQLETHARAFDDLAEGLGYVAALDRTTDGPVPSEGADSDATMGRQDAEAFKRLEQQEAHHQITHQSGTKASELLPQGEIDAFRERIEALSRQPGASRAGDEALAKFDEILTRDDLTREELRMMMSSLEESVTWRRGATRDRPMVTVDMADSSVIRVFEEAMSHTTLEGNPAWQTYSELVQSRYHAQGTLEIGRSPRTTDRGAVAGTNRMRAEFIAAMSDQTALPQATSTVRQHLEDAIAAHGSEAATVAAGDAVWIDSQSGARVDANNPNATLWPADPTWGVWRVDHIVEIQHGGADDISNYFPVSQRMHSVKSDAMNRFGRMVSEQGLVLSSGED